MNKDNLTPKNIIDFKPGDSIYLNVSGTNTSKTYLCEFTKYQGSTVSAVKVSDGTSLRASLGNCALYGKNPVSGHTYYHWFDATGYAISPRVYDLNSANAEVLERHPSYGLIGISRSSSNGSNLYGSNIQHREHITLTIKKSSVDRKFNSNWYRDDGDIIKVILSSVQFAELITTPNVGNGVPCTIDYMNGQRIPEPPFNNERDNHQKEFKNKTENIRNNLKNHTETISELLNKKTFNKTDKETIMTLINGLTQEIVSNLPFVEKSFSEQMDRTVVQAKAEIEAFITRSITEAGRKALFGGDGEQKLIG